MLTGKSTSIRGKTAYYIISDKGMNHFEGPSVFQKLQSAMGINVTTIQGVTIIGNNNVVYQQFADLHRNLDLWSEEIKKSDRLSDQKS